MPKYLLERHKATWQFSKNLSTEENIKILLAKMVCFRQGNLASDPNYLDLFAPYLAPLDMRAFQVAMAMLAESPRVEGQTALPSLGDIMEAMEEAREVWPAFSKGRNTVDTMPLFGETEQRKLNA